jgi:outer membrane receptor protein involved in Fe transport
VAGAAQATTVDGTRATTLPTVLVVGVAPLPGSEVDPDQVAAPVQTADSEDLRRSHALSITEYLNRSFGGVYVNEVQNNPLQPDISYRGYTASPLLGTPQGLSVYLDGMRINQSFGDVVSWDLIPRQAIASLTLMPGSNPVFGLNALGGALALRTKDGFSDPGYSAAVNLGSNSRRQLELEAGGHAASGLYWYGTANRLRDDGWRVESPTDATQLFGKLGWRGAATDIALSGAYADTDLTGNGLQDIQLLRNDYSSVYTKPDNTRNRAYHFNLVVTHRAGDSITLSGNAYYRSIRTATFNGDINDDSLGESVYQPNAAERAALAAAGYTGFPVSGETQGNTPFPSWRCIANILLNTEPNEMCNGLANRTVTNQHDQGVSAQMSISTPLAGRANLLVAGVADLRSGAHFRQSSQFGYLTPDRGIQTVTGPGAFADGSQDSENAFDARVDLSGTTVTRSIYISDSILLLPRLQLTVSGRYDRTAVDSLDGITPPDEAGTLTANHRFSRINPAIGFTVRPNPSMSAYLGYSQNSRAPSAIELGCADPTNPCRLPNAMAGDPPLNQVVTSSVEAGVRGRVARQLAWNFGLFRADNRNDIMFVADDVSGFGYFKNFGRTRRQGVEAGVTMRLGKFSVGANCTWLDATYRSAEELLGEGNSANATGPGFGGVIDVEPGDRMPLIPRQLFKTFANWQIRPRVSANLDILAVSGVIARGNENNQHRPDGVYYLGPGRVGGYSVANAGIEFRPAGVLALFLQLNNIFDRQYFSAAQLGSTGFNAAGNFVARPFAGPIIDGERPLLGTTFVSPGVPRAYWIGIRWNHK